MNSFFKCSHFLFISVAIILCLPSIGQAKKIQIKMATLAPEGSPWHELLVEMGQEWRKATDGEIELRIYPGGIAGDERDMIRKMRIGQLHAAAVTIEGLTEISREMNVFFIPLLVESFDELGFIRNQLQPDLMEDLEKNGFKLLSWADVGWAYWFSRKPITTPSELREMKLFTWAGDYRWAELWKKAGFYPVPLASVDILPSLQTGLIDAISTTPLVALSFQWFGLASHMLDLKWGPMIGAIIMTNQMWEKIPNEYHSRLLEITKRFEKKAQALVPKAEEAMAVMKEHGLVVHTLSQEEKKAWVDLTKSFYPYIRGALIPEEIFDKAILLKEEVDKNKKRAN